MFKVMHAKYFNNLNEITNTLPKIKVLSHLGYGYFI